MGGVEEPNGDTPLAVVADLARRLAEAEVTYCHWKSNESLDRSLTGENDLDLLVDRSHAAQFMSVLAAMGAVQALSYPRPPVLGIEDHFLRDGATGRIVHIQPHFELVVGDDVTKSFRLPVERFMTEVTVDRLLPVPQPEVEYVVFLLRMAIKHCPAEAVLAGKGRLTASERRELAWLEGQLEHDRMVAVRRQALRHVGDDLWDQIRAAIEPDSTLMQRMRAGRSALRALEADARRSPRRDLVLKVWRRSREQVLRRNTTKRLAHGGLIVGVVGGDGSGKSTLVGFLSSHLGHHFDLLRIHLGKPPRSLLTRIIVRTIDFGRQRGRFAATRLPAWTVFEDHPGIVYSLWHWLIARDRLRLYRRARRAAGRGKVIISDRFPTPEIRTMDGVRLTDLPSGSRVADRLARSEAAMYAKIGAPDLLLVLRVPPETALQRRPEQDSDFVSRRASEIWQHDWSSANVCLLDGTLPASRVAADGLRRVWSIL